MENGADDLVSGFQSSWPQGPTALGQGLLSPGHLTRCLSALRSCKVISWRWWGLLGLVGMLPGGEALLWLGLGMEHTNQVGLRHRLYYCWGWGGFMSV